LLPIEFDWADFPDKDHGLLANALENLIRAARGRTSHQRWNVLAAKPTKCGIC
jgi:hypothetical protein